MLRAKRGVSGIISGVFLVAVAVMIFNVLAWQFFQYDAYHRVVLERDQREWERLNERLAILEIVPATDYLNFTVRNYGSVSTHLVALYFSFANGTNLVYSLDLWLGSGTTKRIDNIGPKLTPTDAYDFMIATERGNTYRPSQQLSNAMHPGQGQMMPFIFGFGYADFQVSYDNATWTPAWTTIQRNSQPYFKIFLNNTYPKIAKTRATDTRLSLYPTNDFQSETISETKVDWTISPRSGRWIYFDKTTTNTPNPGKKTWLFVFLQIYYVFLDKPLEIYGTTVAVLSVYMP